MNNNEEKEFKEYAKDSTPDLWDKIEANLPEGMYTKDSSSDNNITSKDNTDSDNNINKKANKVVKFPTRKVYTFAGIVAACLVILSIPLITDSSNNAKKSAGNSATNSIDSNKSIVNNNQESQLNDSSYAYSADNSMNDNSSDNVTSNGITSDNEPSSTATDNTKSQEETTMNPTITLKVTKHHTTDIGLVYEGVIVDTTSTTIKKDDTVYVTLRKLTRHDLLHTYEPNEEFTISLYDDTFTSSPSSPYYALKKIK